MTDSPRTPAEHAQVVREMIEWQINWQTAESPDGPPSWDWPKALDSLAALVALADDDATAFDAGAESVNGEIVCSVCGTNHDRDESAACEGCEPMRLDEWVAHVGALAERQREALRWLQFAMGWEAFRPVRGTNEMMDVIAKIEDVLAGGAGDE